MLSNGALVVIKRGDTALADMIEDGCTPKGKHVRKTTVEDLKAMERDYTIMRVSHSEKIKRAMAESKVKYRRRTRPTPKALEYLQIGYAMAVCGMDAAVRPFRRSWRRLAKKTNHIVKKLRNF